MANENLAGENAPVTGPRKQWPPIEPDETIYRRERWPHWITVKRDMRPGGARGRLIVDVSGHTIELNSDDVTDLAAALKARGEQA